jgi:hypothetical protein
MGAAGALIKRRGEKVLRIKRGNRLKREERENANELGSRRTIGSEPGR